MQQAASTSSSSTFDDQNDFFGRPEPMVEIPYSKDFKVTVVRHVSNILILSSQEGNFNLQMSLDNNLERDVAALLLRGFNDKFQEAPEKIKELSEKDFYRKKEEIWSNQLKKLQAELQEAKDQLE